MTQQNTDENPPAQVLPPQPETADPQVNETLAALSDLADITPAEALERCGVAHEALHQVLTDSAQPTS